MYIYCYAVKYQIIGDTHDPLLVLFLFKGSQMNNAFGVLIRFNFMRLSVKDDYDRVFETGQTLVQGGPIEFFVRGADGVSLDLHNSKLEVKLKITLENGNDLGGGDSVGPLNDIINALFMSMQMELGGLLVSDI